MLKPFKYSILAIFIFCCFLQNLLFAQYNPIGVPKITNFESKDYGYESQNFDLIQGKDGLIYIGNTDGILEYDNQSWNLIRMTGTPKMDVDCYQRIYVSGFDSIGYLVKTRYGTKFKSVLNETITNPGQINKVVALCGESFFATDTCIYRYKNDELSCIFRTANKLKIYSVAENLYVYIDDQGLYRYQSGEFKLINSFRQFKDNGFNDMCLFKGELIVKPHRSFGLFIEKSDRIHRFYTQIDQMLEDANVSRIINYENKYLIIGTEVNGIFIINDKGKLVFHLDKSSGLADNHVSNMFIDKDKQLWVSTYNGISYVSLSSPFTFFTSDKRLNVSILSMAEHKNRFYISTNQGVYYRLKLKTDVNNLVYTDNLTLFGKVKNLNLRVKKLISLNDYLYACTDYGLYLIEGESAKLLYEGDFEDMLASGVFDKQIYISSSNGLIIGKQNTDGDIENLGYIKNLDVSIRTIAEEKNGDLWLGSNNNGLFKIEFSKACELDPQLIHIQRGYGLPQNYDWIDVYNTRSGILFSTYNGVYRYTKEALFEKDSLLGIDFSDNKRWVFPIHEDKKGNLWLSSGIKGQYKKLTAFLSYNENSNTYEISYFPFECISDRTIECIYSTDKGITWFGSISGLIRYEQTSTVEDTTKVHCLLRHISIAEDTVLLDGAVYTKHSNTFPLPVVFNHRQRNIRFEFSAPMYQSGEEITYQTKLEGFQDNWSGWSEEHFKEYTNLKSNNYKFLVRAKDSYGNVSEVSDFSFVIKPPLYLSWWGFLFYIAIILSLINMINRQNRYKHAREKYELESIIATRTEELLNQKEQTERLVNRILPKRTVEEIKAKGKASSKRYEMATVLFADIQGFTKIAEETKPELLIKQLDIVFKSFDQIIEKYDIEKIKTIGDAYMCAGGIPTPNSTNPVEVALAALEMQQVVSRINKEEGVNFNVRIGIHTGPLVAGVVGTQRIAYDIWGDTVNIASRMETHGEVGQVNISSATYSHIKDFFHCMYRGKNAVKYKGDLDMYYIKSIRRELNKGTGEISPNNDFIVKLQMVRLQDLQNDILDKLEKNLPKNLYYHNLKHTVNVFYQTETIARHEGVSEKQMLLLKTAALLHDIGYLVSYDHHEEKGVDIAWKTLPGYNYSQEQIQQISELILATKSPQKPKNLLEEIICDADLDYLGRPDFIPTSQNLFRELFERNKIGTIEQWNRLQMKFMEKHRYFTATARRLREPEKQKRLAELKKML